MFALIMEFRQSLLKRMGHHPQLPTDTPGTAQVKSGTDPQGVAVTPAEPCRMQKYFSEFALDVAVVFAVWPIYLPIGSRDH